MHKHLRMKTSVVQFDVVQEDLRQDIGELLEAGVLREAGPLLVHVLSETSAGQGGHS